MLENIITIAIIGLLAGFIFSMPVAGPISIVIISNALKGKLRFCFRLAMGSVIIEFLYVLIAVYGIAVLYPYYKPAIPYILFIGSIFLLFTAFKIIRTKLKLDNLDSDSILNDKIANRGGFRIGLILNVTNPSLFLGWLISSFMIFSFASSLGIDTGGLEQALNDNVSAVTKIAGEEFDYDINTEQIGNSADNSTEPVSILLLTVVYAVTVAIGGLAWLYGFAKFVVTHRAKLNIIFLNRFVQSLGIVLLVLSIYLAFEGIRLLNLI